MNKTKKAFYRSHVQPTKPFYVQGKKLRMYTVVIETHEGKETETFYSKAKAIEYMNTQDLFPIIK